VGKEPDEIRAEIEQTRAELGRDVDTLTEKVSPARVMERRVDKVKSTFSDAKDKIMGTADGTKAHISDGISGGTSAVGDTMSSAGHAVGSAGHAVGSAASTVAATTADAVTGAPEFAKQRAQGNPVAAGLVAFGAGWLASTLFPASKLEKQAGHAVKDQVAEPVKSGLAQVASDLKDNLEPHAMNAMESVKATAADAANTVKETAADKTTEVKEQAADSATTVKETTTGTGSAYSTSGSGGYTG
jgi:phage-related protein